MSRPRNSRTYLVPTLLTIASLAGLVSALIGDGVFNLISWLILGGLLAVIVWALATRRA